MPEKMSSMGTKRPSPVVYGIETEYSCLLTFPGHVTAHANATVGHG